MIFLRSHGGFLLYCLLYNLQLIFANLKLSGARKNHLQGGKNIGSQRNTTSTHQFTVPSQHNTEKVYQKGHYLQKIKFIGIQRERGTHTHKRHKDHFLSLKKIQAIKRRHKKVHHGHKKKSRKLWRKKSNVRKHLSQGKKRSLIVPLFSQDELVLLENVKQILQFIGKSRSDFRFSSLDTRDSDLNDLSLVTSKKEKISNNTKLKTPVSSRNYLIMKNMDNGGNKNRKTAIQSDLTNVSLTVSKKEEISNNMTLTTPMYSKNYSMSKYSVERGNKKLKTITPSKKFAIDLGATNTIHAPEKELLGDHELMENKGKDSDSTNIFDKDSPLQSHFRNPTEGLRKYNGLKLPGTEDKSLANLKPSSDDSRSELLEDMTTPISDQNSNQGLTSDVTTVPVDPPPGTSTDDLTDSAVKLNDINKLSENLPSWEADTMSKDRSLNSRSYMVDERTGNKKQIGPHRSRCQQLLIDKMGSKLYEKLLEGDRSSPQWVQSMAGDVTDTAKEKTKHDNNVQDIQEIQQLNAADEANENSASIFEKADTSLEKDPGGFLGYQYSKLKNILTQKNLTYLPKETYVPQNTSEKEEPKVDCKESLLDGLRQKAKLKKAQESEDLQSDTSEMNVSESTTKRPTMDDFSAENDQQGSESKDDNQKSPAYLSKSKNGDEGSKGIQEKNSPSQSQSSALKEGKVIQDASNAVGAGNALDATEQNPTVDNYFPADQPLPPDMQLQNDKNPIYGKFRNEWQLQKGVMNPSGQFQVERHVRPKTRKLLTNPNMYNKQMNNVLVQKQGVIFKGANPSENNGLEIVPVDPDIPDSNADLLQKSRKKLSEASYRLGDKVLRRIQKSIFFTTDDHSPEDQAVRDALNATLSSEERKEFIKEFLLLKALEELYAKTDWERLNKEADEEASKIEKLGEMKQKTDTPVESRSTQVASPAASNSTSIKNNTFVGCKNGTLNENGKIGSCKVREGAYYVSKNSTFSFEDDGMRKMKNVTAMFKNGTSTPDLGSDNEENTNGFGDQMVKPWRVRLITNNPTTKTLPNKFEKNITADKKPQLDKGSNQTDKSKTNYTSTLNNKVNVTQQQPAVKGQEAGETRNDSDAGTQVLQHENSTGVEKARSGSNASKSENEHEPRAYTKNDIVDDPPSNTTNVKTNEVSENGQSSVKENNGNLTEDSPVIHRHILGRESRFASGLHSHFLRFRRKERARYRNNTKQLHLRIPHRQNQGHDNTHRENQGHDNPHDKNQGHDVLNGENQGHDNPHDANQGHDIPHDENQGHDISHGDNQGQDIPHDETQGHDTPHGENQGHDIPQSENQGHNIPHSENQGDDILPHGDKEHREQGVQSEIKASPPADVPSENKPMTTKDSKFEEHDYSSVASMDQEAKGQDKVSAEQAENSDQGNNEGNEQLGNSSVPPEVDGGENAHKDNAHTEPEVIIAEKSSLKEADDEHNSENNGHDEPNSPSMDTQPEPENLLEDEKKISRKNDKQVIHEVGLGVLKVSKEGKQESAIAEEAKNIVEKLTSYPQEGTVSERTTNNAEQDVIPPKQAEQGQETSDYGRVSSDEQGPEPEHARQETDSQSVHSEQNGQGGEEEVHASEDVAPDSEHDRSEAEHSQLNSNQEHQTTDKVSHEEENYPQTDGQGQDKDGNDQGNEEPAEVQSQGTEEPSREEDIPENGEYNSSHAEQTTNDESSKAEDPAPASDQYDPYTTFKKSLVQKGVTYVKKKQELFIALIRKIRSNLLHIITSKIITKKSIIVRRSRLKRQEREVKYLNDLKTFLSAHTSTFGDLKTGISVSRNV